LDIVKFLLEKGADVNAMDNQDETPIQDAVRNGKSQVVDYLIQKGGELPSQIMQAVRNPEFQMSLNKSLPILCERGRFQYGETWIVAKGGKTIVPTYSYFVDEEITSKMQKLQHSLDDIIYKKDSSLIGRCWKERKAIFIPKLSEEDIDNYKAAKDCEIVSGIALPLIYDNIFVGVITLYSFQEERDLAEKLIRNYEKYANRLISAGVPGLPLKSSKKYQQMDEVIKIMSKEGSFDATHVFYEVERFYNHLEMSADYFQHFPSQTIAKHIQSLIAAKKVAHTSGKRENISFVNESTDVAYYMCASTKDKISALESRIEEYLLATPKTHGYALESYESTGNIIPNGNARLRMYTVRRFAHKKAPKGAKPNDLNHLADDNFFRSKKESTIERYQSVVDESVDKLAPVLKQYAKIEDGTIPLLMAFQKSSEQSFLYELSEIVDSIEGCECKKKFVQSFSNGLVIYSLYFITKNSANVAEVLNKASLLAIIPPTKLYTLFLNRTMTARQMMYAYSASKFCFYFTHRSTEEYQILAKHLANDPANLGRLFTIQNKLKKDSLPESRVIDCIFNHTDLVFEIFVDFAKIAGGEQSPAFNRDLHKKILKLVYDEVDATILTSFLIFNAHLLKTNFYKFEKAAISYRLSPDFLKDSNYPEVPFAVFLVIGSEFMGFHIRFRDVARGGIRVIKSMNSQAYSFNSEGLFSEGYGLANTQQRKNKDIPEGGSKGTILLYQTHQTHTVVAFQKYVDALLDLLLLTGESDVHDHYGKEEILFLGPDENTANVMDWAALHAKKRGYKFWKAFTTGKSNTIGGIPHDVYGMTTNSVHQYVLGIYERLGLDETKITKISTGGPDGDLGGNEILMSQDKTISIVDGSGVLYDPEGLNRDELVRLVKEKSMIGNYDTKLLSSNGFRIKIEENDVTLPSGEIVESGVSFRNNFHLHELFTADLFVPCGGRPASISATNVNKLFKKNGEAKFKYIVEGANLFITQEARLMLEEAGVVLFKDATANKGGVTSSSLEVLAALSFHNDEFEIDMAVKDGKIPEFYQAYVVEVQQVVKNNARLEFNCIWDEHERTGIPRSKLSDLISNKINELNDRIKDSNLWENKKLVKTVMKTALPQSLLAKLGLEAILQRVPDNYLRAIFSCHLASHYVYKFGLDATEFNFFEFMENLLEKSKTE
jgi:glutamate dehydrogenase